MSKINPWLGGAAALLCAASWFQPAVAGSDLWWHLAAGREIWQLGWVASVDVFSSTAVGRPWTNHEWLWGVIVWRLYALHPAAVAWLNLGVLLAAWALMLRVTQRACGSLLAAGASLWLAAATAHWFFDIRPHLVTLLLVGLFLATRHRARAPWLWPPLVALWANLHAGFVFGVGMIGLHVLFRTAERSLAERRLAAPWLEWTALAACALAMTVNPWGVQILDYPLAYLDADSPFRRIIEWRPPELSLDAWRYDGRFWWMVALFALGTFRTAERDLLPVWRSRDARADALARALPGLYALALAGVCCAMAVTSRRFIPLFAFTAAPVIAIGLAVPLGVLGARLPAVRGQRAALATTAAGLLLALLLWRDVRLLPDPLYRWTQFSFYPHGAVTYLRSLPPPRRLFNLYNWGGYLMLHARGLPVFIDGRANTVYDERIYNDYQVIAAASPGFATLMRGYGVDLVLFSRDARLVQLLLRPPHSWRPIYQDRLAILLAPPGSPYLAGGMPDPDQVANRTPDGLILRAREATAAGRLEEAERVVERALELEPLHLTAFAELARVRALAGDLAGLEAAIERGVRTIPRERLRLAEFAGYSYELGGDLDLAIDWLRRGLPTGPFRGRGAVESYLRRLEERRAGAAAQGEQAG